MDTIILGSGPDGRVVAEYLARRKRMRDWTSTPSTDDINEIWLDMARKHKRPIRELKDVLNRWQIQTYPNRTMTPPVRIVPKVCDCGETESLKWTDLWFYDSTERWWCPACTEREEKGYYA